MGKGDKKSKKGKLAMGSFGNSRPHKTEAKAVSPSPKKEKVKAAPKAKAEAAPKAEKKVAAKKTTKKAE
jgi:30S ribosomal protein S31